MTIGARCLAPVLLYAGDSEPLHGDVQEEVVCRRPLPHLQPDGLQRQGQHRGALQLLVLHPGGGD